MGFNRAKCQVLHLEGNNSMYQYRLQAKQLESSLAEEDWRGLVDTKLIKVPLAAKANSLLGYIRKSADKVEGSHSALGRLLLKYCSFLEHCSRLPSTRKTQTCWRNSTESITKMIKGLDHLSSEERQRELKLFSLRNRRFINLCKYMILGNKQPTAISGRKSGNMYV